MKWIILLVTLLLSACGLNNPDNVAYRQVIIPSPTDKTNLWDNNPTLDVTTNRTVYL